MEPKEMEGHREAIKDWEQRKTSPGVVIVVAILVSIPLALCCYLLLR